MRHTSGASLIGKTHEQSAARPSHVVPSDPAHRLPWLKATLVVAFAANLLLSARLWLGSHAYPLAPVWDSLPQIHVPWDYVCLMALFGLLTAILVMRQPCPYLIAFVGLVAVYSLWDQARWTPPVYHYTFMLAALGFYSWRRSDASTGEAVLNACRVIIAATYVWAGLKKVNVTFIRDVFPWILKPLVGTLPDTFRGLPVPLGLGAALMEAGIGMGLLLVPTRQIAVVAAVTMHAFILVLIGPLGHWWDRNVWAWNIASAALVVLLFWRTDQVGVREILAPRRLSFQWAVLALFGVMPALSLIGLWDAYLSGEFYTGATRHGVIRMTDQMKAALPADIRQYVRRSRSGDEVLDLMRWAVAERNVEPYPEVRVFKATARELCRYSEDSSAMTLVIYESPHWRTGRRTTTHYSCADLRGRPRAIADGKAGAGKPRE